MRVRLLGPVELHEPDGSAVPIAAPKRRAVLAVLALELNRVVPVERLLDLIWDGAPPPRARSALQGHVSALRRLLTAPGLTLVTRDPGYALLGAASEVDLHLFRSCYDQATGTADDRTAADLLGRALDLWQGRPLADLPSAALRDDAAAGLGQLRLAALEAWGERKLRLSLGREVLPALEQAVRDDPLREPLIRLLLLAFHQADRQADAIELFQRTRKLLSTELGVDPGAPLRAAYQTVLRAEAAVTDRPAHVDRPAHPDRPAPADRPAHLDRPVVPAQLPGESAGFVGRRKELEALDRACGAGAEPGLALVVGPAGVGKSTLTLHWAHRRAADFRDGQLFADLQGFSATSPVTTASVLAGFLHALGAPDSDIPSDLGQRVALYRSLLAGRRLLVVLDNVRVVADVLPLLPSGPGCAAVVTSRNLLDSLVARQGASVLRIEALAPQESRDLLAGTVGGSRIAAEEEAARELVRLCDGLPLALRVAGARLATHPDWTVADLVGELSDEQARLAGLTTDDADLGVEAALSLSYRALPGPAAELFRLLGLHPGPDVDRWSAAALVGRSPAETRQTLAALASSHLLQETRPGRFARHDLVRLYTVQLAQRGLSTQVRDEALGRLLDYYLAATAAAAEPASSQPKLLYRPRPGSVEIPALDGTAECPARWFRSEATTVRALVAGSADGPRAGQAWRIACNTMPLYFGTEHVDDWLAASLAGLRAAESDGEMSGRSRLHAEVGMALEERGEYPEAMRHLERSVRLARESDSREARHLALFRLGIGQLGAGALPQARQTIESCLQEARELRDVPAQAQSLNNLGHAHNLLGSHLEALACAEQARDLTAGAPSSHTHLASLCTITEALQALGRRAEAIGCAREAVRLCRASGNPAFEAHALYLVGQLQKDLGRPADSARSLRQSRDLLAPLGRTEAADR